MYQKFKDCLLKPSRIGYYVDEKIIKTIIYFVLLLLIYSLPTIVSLTSIKEMPTEYSNLIVEGFSNSDVVNYKIENSQLISTTENSKTQHINLGTVSSLQANIIVLFTNEDNFDITKYDFNDSLSNKSVIVFSFTTDKILINSGTLVEVDSTENIPSNKTPSTISFTYEELGIEKIDFTKARYNKTSFKKELNDLYVNIYNKNKALILLSGMSFAIIGNAFAMLLEILFLALLIKLLYSKLNVKYGAICKIVIFAYTPQVVFNLLSIFYTNMFMYFLGQILSIVYITIAIKFYSLNNIVKNLGTSIADIIEKSKEKQGDDNNEL